MNIIVYIQYKIIVNKKNKGAMLPC